MPQKPKLGISACLLGEKVRYDGGHKLDHYLADLLGRFVEWVPVCPEVECGLPVPRESMRLVGGPEAPRLIAQRSGTDHTQRMLSWAEKRLAELGQEDLCGFVFKSRSPSSGMQGVRIYSEKGMPVKKGSGLFAAAFMSRFPLVPVEDEGRLNDPELRENFIERIFVFFRWKEMLDKRPRIADFMEFHASHKLLFMSHHPKAVTLLGQTVARADRQNLRPVLDQYLEIMMTELKRIATGKKNVNVLHHIMGYFKKQLSADEKQELLEIIDSYHNGLIPLIVPVTLLNHYVRKFGEPYLSRQVYLHPHPLELMLRNHV
ncbi:DUF523 and DUF1722 domain-containing protein [bacterium]|nr:DUF523 and DUF1722 domain-containing protein [bacterium]